MEYSKLVFLLVLFSVVGLTFCVTGLYLISEKYLNKINSNKLFVKTAGWLAFGIGDLTIITGILIFVFSSLFEYLIVIYLGILFIAACLAMIFAKLKKK
jgi:hypothetical protein